MAGVQGLLGRTAVNIYVQVGPGGDVAERGGTALGQSSYLYGLQHPIPQVELGKLPDQGLRGIESPAQRILQGEEIEKGLEWLDVKMLA